MGEERTEAAQQDARPQTQHVSVGEAAKLLGVHRNTVHHRIKNGHIRAHKVLEGEREVYRIERDSLGIGRTDAQVHTLDAQRPIPGEDIARLLANRLEDIVQGHALELGDVREQLGEERARRQHAEEEAERLRKELETERSKGFWQRLIGA